MTLPTHASSGDRALARAILQLDVAGVSDALAAGATAHKTPFEQISWALLPVCISMQRRGPLRAFTDDVRAILRTLLHNGAPTLGIHQLLEAGVRFGHEDVILCLDHWLRRDTDGIASVLHLLQDDDAMLAALTKAEHVPLDLVMRSGRGVFAHAVGRDMAATVRALCERGANPNLTVLHESMGEVSAIESCVREGRLRTAMVLLVFGAAHDRARLEQCAAGHSEAATRTVAECMDAVQKGKVQSLEALLELPSLRFFVDALSAALQPPPPSPRVAQMAAIEATCVAFTASVAKLDLAAG